MNNLLERHYKKVVAVCIEYTRTVVPAKYCRKRKRFGFHIQFVELSVLCWQLNWNKIKPKHDFTL